MEPARRAFVQRTRQRREWHKGFAAMASASLCRIAVASATREHAFIAADRVVRWGARRSY
jgi:hypothetical protein